MQAILNMLEKQTMSQTAEWVTCCRTIDCFQRPGAEERNKIIFSIKGSWTLTFRVPNQQRGHDEEGDVQGMEPYEYPAHPLETPLVGSLVEADAVDREIRRQVPIESLITTVLCSSGGTRMRGKAPPGAVAYTLSGRAAKKKAKGKAKAKGSGK